MARVYGYIRVSSKDQNEDRQRYKMEQKGVDERFLFVDKASGKDFERPEYKLLRRVINKGDLIYMDALDRLGRNYDEVLAEWKYITREVGADIVLLDNESLFDSRKFRAMGDMGKLMEDQFLSLLSCMLPTKSVRRYGRDRRRASRQPSVEGNISEGLALLTRRWTMSSALHSFENINVGRKENKLLFNRSKMQTLRSQHGIRSLMNTRRQSRSKASVFICA